MTKRTKNRILKTSTALSTPPKDVKTVDLTIQVEPVEAVDPLAEVANLPEKLANEVSDERFSANSGLGTTGAKDVFGAPQSGSMFPWPLQAKLFEMAETNTRFILRFVESFARVRYPQDLLALTADFSKEGTVLFEQQSSAMFRSFVGQPAD